MRYTAVQRTSAGVQWRGRAWPGLAWPGRAGPGRAGLARLRHRNSLAARVLGGGRALIPVVAHRVRLHEVEALHRLSAAAAAALQYAGDARRDPLALILVSVLGVVLSTTPCAYTHKLSYRRGTARRSKSAEILSTAAQLYRPTKNRT